jgi:RHS repeat-associated protein
MSLNFVYLSHKSTNKRSREGKSDAGLYKYKYNGQELQNELGLNITAMDFRQYDNALGRFACMDAMSEYAKSQSPFRFGFNNPIMFSDPTGLFEEKMLYPEGAGTSKGQVHKDADGEWEWNGELWVGKNGSNNFIPAAIVTGTTTKSYSWSDLKYDYLSFMNKADRWADDWGQSAGQFIAGFHPGVALTNAYKGYTEGENMYGEKMGNTGATIEALSALPIGKVLKIKVVTALAKNKAAGKAMEEALGMTASKTKIDVAGRIRFPDRINLFNKTLEEAKNVKHLNFTSQLRDYLQYAQDNGLQMILHTRSTTTFSGPLQKAIDEGSIILNKVNGF